MATPASAVTISRAAEILGQDEELLWDVVDEMEPEDGCLWIYGTGDEQTISFTAAGMEYLREMLPHYKDKRSPPQS
jgi:hypothetical protein